MTPVRCSTCKLCPQQPLAVIQKATKLSAEHLFLALSSEPCIIATFLTCYVQALSSIYLTGFALKVKTLTELRT